MGNKSKQNINGDGNYQVNGDFTLNEFYSTIKKFKTLIQLLRLQRR